MPGIQPPQHEWEPAYDPKLASALRFAITPAVEQVQTITEVKHAQMSEHTYITNQESEPDTK